jgi:tRNA 2-selenouridine synthase
LKQLAGGRKRIYLEDEGRLIGRLSLPDVLRERMATAPLAIVEEPIERRIEVVLEDYVIDLGRRYAERHGAQGPELHRQKLQSDLLRIRKRLGGALQQSVSAMMDDAFELEAGASSLDRHRRWIRVLLADYYDPMYDYQLSRRSGQRQFSGDRDAVVAWAEGKAG